MHWSNLPFIESFYLQLILFKQSEKTFQIIAEPWVWLHRQRPPKNARSHQQTLWQTDMVNKIQALNNKQIHKIVITKIFWFYSVAEPTLAATTKTSKPEEPNSTMESQENGEVPAKKPKRVRTRPSKKKQQEANLMMIQQASTPPENATMATIQALNSAQNRHVRFSDDPEHISDKAPENTDLTANADILTELKTYRVCFHCKLIY